jgi:hypothetical protein
MRALLLEARRRNAFAQAFAAAANWLANRRPPPRRWHDERERRAFFAELEARGLSHLVQPGMGRRRFM